MAVLLDQNLAQAAEPGESTNTLQHAEVSAQTDQVDAGDALLARQVLPLAATTMATSPTADAQLPVQDTHEILLPTNHNRILMPQERNPREFRSRMDIKPVVSLVPPVRIKKVNPSDSRDERKQRKPSEQPQPAEQESPDAKIDTYA